jgi:tellurite resistance protein
MAKAPQYLVEVHGDPATHAAHEIPMKAQVDFGKAVLVIAAADGVLSDVERNYFIEMARGFGAPEAALEEYRKFDPKSAKLEDLLDPEYRHMARHFVYDAIRVSRADGYHEKEAAAVRKAAKSLNVDDWVVSSLEALIEAEDGLRKTRHSILQPPRAK